MGKVNFGDIEILQEVVDELEIEFFEGLSETFKNAGLLSTFEGQFTPAVMLSIEMMQFNQYDLLMANKKAEAAYEGLRITNMFTGVARQVANDCKMSWYNDRELAKAVPEHFKPTQEAIDAMKRYDFDDLASVLECVD